MEQGVSTLQRNIYMHARKLHFKLPHTKLRIMNLAKQAS